jgi:hypothetical protein
MEPTPRDVRHSQLLTNISLGYRQDGYIAELLYPIVKVQKETAKIVTYGMDNLRIEQSLRAPGASANTVGHSVSIGDHYALEEHAYKEDIPDEVRDNAERPINADKDSTENLTDRLLVRKEKDLADIVRSPSVITQTATPTYTWDDGVNSVPFEDVKTAKTTIRSATGKEANTMMVSWDVLQELLIHPTILGRFPGADMITQQMLLDNVSRLFGLERMLVGKAQYNSATEGQTDSLTDIWTSDVIIAYIDPKPTQKSQTLGRTYQSTKAQRKALKWRDPDRSAKKDWVSVSDKYDQKTVNAACAYLLDDAI